MHVTDPCQFRESKDSLGRRCAILHEVKGVRDLLAVQERARAARSLERLARIVCEARLRTTSGHS
jgi:hypothetical protein